MTRFLDDHEAELHQAWTSAPPIPGVWRVPMLGLLLLLMLLGTALLPSMKQAVAALASPGINDDLGIELSDGRRLSCERCRKMITSLRRRALPVETGHPAVVSPPGRKSPSKPVAIAKTEPVQPIRALAHIASRRSGGAGFGADLELLLPRYRGDFERAAQRNGLDWRLLAAVGYQESRWNSQAESPTGVRGLMMLTTDTAHGLGVNRDDAAQSIAGAGRLLQSLFEQLPPQIHEPDRTAMVLAAYNQGIGHLLDARDVAVNLGGDPDRWSDVRVALPLLSDAEWQKTTKYGFARGAEAVAFVDSVRLYYNRLTAMTQSGALRKTRASSGGNRSTVQ